MFTIQRELYRKTLHKLRGVMLISLNDAYLYVMYKLIQKGKCSNKKEPLT